MNNANDGLAIVTGAGTGLGRAMAIELVRQGQKVAGFGRRADLLEETAAKAGAGFFPCVLDISDAAKVGQTISELSQKIAPVTILINNAAVYPRFDFLDEYPKEFMHCVAINLGGMVNCSHAALKQMIQTGKGRIMNVSTFADISPMPLSSAYSVSKGAGRIFTRALLADIGDRFPGIVINDWIPGALDTAMGIRDGITPEAAAGWGVKLALWNDPSLSGSIWARNEEQLPAISLKGRIKNKLFFRTLVARNLDHVHL